MFRLPISSKDIHFDLFLFFIPFSLNFHRRHQSLTLNEKYLAFFSCEGILTNDQGNIVSDSQNRNINGNRHVAIMTLSHYLKWDPFDRTKSSQGLIVTNKCLFSVL